MLGNSQGSGRKGTQSGVCVGGGVHSTGVGIFFVPLLFVPLYPFCNISGFICLSLICVCFDCIDPPTPHCTLSCGSVVKVNVLFSLRELISSFIASIQSSDFDEFMASLKVFGTLHNIL